MQTGVRGGAQHGLGHRTHQQLAYPARRMCAHHHAIDRLLALPLSQVGDNLHRRASPGRTTVSHSMPACPDSLGQRLQIAPTRSARGGGFIVAADARSLCVVTTTVS